MSTTDDERNPEYVLGAVLAQVEDLSMRDRIRVLADALSQVTPKTPMARAAKHTPECAGHTHLWVAGGVHHDAAGVTRCSTCNGTLYDEQPEDNEPKCPACGNADLGLFSVSRDCMRFYSLDLCDEGEADGMIYLDEDRGGDDGGGDEPRIRCLKCNATGPLDAFGIVDWDWS